MKLSREFKTAVVAIGSIVLFIWGYNYMKGRNLFKGSVPVYYTEYSAVEGLTTSSKVKLQGVPIGKVQSTKLITKDDKLKVLVEFSIDEKDIEFSKNSIIRLQSDGLMGGKSLAIIPKDGETAVSGDNLQGSIQSDMFSEVGSKLDPLQKKLARVLVASDSLILGLNDVLDTKTRNNIKASIAKFNKTMTDFNGVSASLKTILDDNKAALEETLTSAKDAGANITTLTDKLNAELEEAKIAATILELKNTIAGINTILDGLNKGEGSMGKLLKDEQMYTNLTNASKELEELLKEMKDHPKRFVHFSVFGKKDKESDDE